MMKRETKDKVGEGKGPVGDVPGYVPMGEEWRIKEVCGDWVHYNDGVRLSGGVKADQVWQLRWIT